MLKFWTTGVNADAFLIESAEIRLERSPGATFVTDRDGIPHRIAGAVSARPVRLAIRIPENALALENSQPLAFGYVLSTLFESGGSIVFMESTTGRAYQGVVCELDGRVGARKGRLADEDGFVVVVFWLKHFGTYSDWANIGSVAWED